jgi:hypothetical protein
MQTPTAQALPAKAGMILQVKDVRPRGEELNGQLAPAIARCGGGMCKLVCSPNFTVFSLQKS